MRRPFIAANWKMHKTVVDAATFARAFASRVSAVPDVVLAPVFTALAAVGVEIDGTRIGLCAQDIAVEDSGAFTGEIGGPLLRDVGCTHALIGHSERRLHQAESDDLIAKKVTAALRNRLIPIICVGEQLADREAGRTLEVVLGQLDAALGDHDPATLSRIIIAYEPVWAIGTGRTATPKDAQEVHAAIRKNLVRRDSALAERVRVIYGGSVKPDSARALLSEPDVDGLLVGGASLEMTSFLAICEAAT